MRTLLLDETSSAPAWASSPPPPVLATGAGQRSPWHSPVPYLFGGLAAMLGLIAFALLILACSYWKFSGQNYSDGGDGGDVEKGAAEKGKEMVRIYEEKIVVIMAGDEKPSYLATPVCSRGPSFGGDCNRKSEDQGTKKEENGFGSKVNDDGTNDGADAAADHHHHHEHIPAVVEPVENGEAPSLGTVANQVQVDR